MEVEANREFNQLNTRIALRTRPGTSRGKAKAADDLPAPKVSRPKPKAPAKSKELKKAETSVGRPKAPGNRPPAKRERVKRAHEEEMEVNLWLEYEGREGMYTEYGPPRKRVRQEQPTGPFAWSAGTSEAAAARAQIRYHSRYHEESYGEESSD